MGTAVGVAALAGVMVWRSTQGVAVLPPETTGAVAQACSALHGALPASLLGHARRATRPASADTAAWGDPAIVLRCGVSSPPALTPGARSYDPTTAAMDLGGVCWVSSQTRTAWVFTTVKQQAYVEVTVPDAYQGGESPLLGLASAIQKHDPVAPDRVFDCS